MPSGDFRYKVGFYQRGSSGSAGSPPPPDYGSGPGYPTTATFTCFADIAPRLGGETIVADRLTGRNFVDITVRMSSLTKQIDTDWMCKDENTGEVYNIRSVIDPYQGAIRHGQFIEMLCEKGVANA
jgi:head-tail adaptor